MTPIEVLAHLEKTLLADLDAMAEKERAAFWLNCKEYEEAKRQRVTAAPLGEGDKGFEVVHIKSAITDN